MLQLIGSAHQSTCKLNACRRFDVNILQIVDEDVQVRDFVQFFQPLSCRHMPFRKDPHGDKHFCFHDYYKLFEFKYTWCNACDEFLSGCINMLGV